MRLSGPTSVRSGQPVIMPSCFSRMPVMGLRRAALGEWWQTTPDRAKRRLMAIWMARSGAARVIARRPSHADNFRPCGCCKSPFA